MKRPPWSWLGIFALLLPTALAAQTEAVLAKRATELRDAPNDKGRSLAAVAAQAPLTRLGARFGAWIQVRDARGVAGWLHMFDVTAANAPGQGSSVGAGLARGVGGLFGGGSATTATSLVGVRGLGAEDIANAQPDLAAVTRAEALRVNANSARQFAAAAGLRAARVDELPEPATPAAGQRQNLSQ